MNIRLKIPKVSLHTLLFIFYNFYYISGYSSSIHNYVIVALFLAWNILAFIEDRAAYSYAINSKCFLSVLTFLMFYIITSVFTAGLTYTLEYAVIFLCLYGTALQYRYYSYRNNSQEQHFVVVGILTAFIVFSITAIMFYTIYPSAARMLASDFYAFDNIAIGGGYSIAFGASMLSAYLFELIRRKRLLIGRTRVLAIIYFILLELLIIKTESTTTLIANLFGIVIGIINSMYVNNKKKSANRFIISILVLSAAIIVMFNLNEIGDYIVKNTSARLDDVLFRRFNRIGNKLLYFGTGNSSANYVDERLGTITQSRETFLNHPFLGVGYLCGNIYSELGEAGVGLHSELFDALAQFGIIGFIPWSGIFITSLKQQKSINKCKGWKYALLIMMIFNPFKAYHGYIVSFFLISMMENLIEQKYCYHEGEV